MIIDIATIRANDEENGSIITISFNTEAKDRYVSMIADNGEDLMYYAESFTEAVDYTYSYQSWSTFCPVDFSESDDTYLGHDLPSLYDADLPEFSETGFYILTDLSGYGSDSPVCVDKAERNRLILSGWTLDGWREADEDDLDKYGAYRAD